MHSDFTTPGQPIRPIETQYAGCRFRSRLEARWAVAFDAMGIVWEYEPEGYVLADGTWYLPDFWLPWTDEMRELIHFPTAGFWVEIKPAALTDREQQNCSLLATGTGHKVFALVGSCGVGKFTVQKWSHLDGEMTASCAEDSMPHDYLLYRCSDGSVSPWDERPFTAARGARFEHGESP